jgi:two-component system response regulator BaeR
MSTAEILIVEDEAKLAQLLADYLQQAGYATHCIGDGNAVIERVKSQPPAAILLDIMLPGRDGISLCREIREFSGVPILMVTARVDEIDRLLGLELGADDYICKPFSPREVVARVKAVLRRAAPVLPSESAAAPQMLDAARNQFVHDGTRLDLTAVEYRLIETLASEPGRIFNRQQLMDRIYPDRRVVSDRTIDSHVKKLRKRLGEAFPGCEFIHSVYGLGYRFELL